MKSTDAKILSFKTGVDFQIYNMIDLALIWVWEGLGVGVG